MAQGPAVPLLMGRPDRINETDPIEQFSSECFDPEQQINFWGAPRSPAMRSLPCRPPCACASPAQGSVCLKVCIIGQHVGHAHHAPPARPERMPRAAGNSGFNDSIKATVVLSGAHSIGNVRAAKMRNCTQAKGDGLVRARRARPLAGSLQTGKGGMLHMQRARDEPAALAAPPRMHELRGRAQPGASEVSSF